MKHIHGEVQTENTAPISTLKNGKFQRPKFRAASKTYRENLKNSFNGANSMLASPELP